MTYYHVRLTPKGKGIDDEVMTDLSYQELEERFLTPYRNGNPITINGRTIAIDNLERIKVTKSAVDSSQLQRVIDLDTRETSVLGLKPGSKPDSWRVIDKETDVTNELIVGPPGRESDSNKEAVQEPRPPQNTQEVFVVHGRNEKAREALFTFLRSIGLAPLKLTSIVQSTNAGSPYVGQILKEAFNPEQAVIVLLTPDDEARLREPFRSPTDKPCESELTGQARPNVLFEAGMAMGRSEERTILVELGEVKEFSDVAGRHMIKLNNTSQRRQELAQRLQNAGCPVNLDDTDWHEAGNFEAAVDSIAQGQPDTVAEATQQSELEEKREYTDRTAQDITDEAPMHIADEETVVSPEIGKWLRVDSEVFLNFDTTLDPIELVVARDGQPFIKLFFDNERWGRQLVHRKHGDRVVAKGKITEVEPLGLALHDCELLDLVE